MAASCSTRNGMHDVTPAAENGTKYLAELEELRRLMGAIQAFVVTDPSRIRRRVLAASPNVVRTRYSRLNGIPKGYQAFQRGGCSFVLDNAQPNGSSEISSLHRTEPEKSQIEHLVARSLGKLVLGAEDSLISQVSDSDSRCLAASSSCLLKILEEAESIAGSGRPALIAGETGVGKELRARNGSRTPVLGLKNLLEAMRSPISAWDEYRGRGIREIRKILGMSLREFSQVVGIPKSSLDDMEKGGASGKSADVIRSVCSYLENLPHAKEPNPRAKQGASRVKEELKRFIEEE